MLNVKKYISCVASLAALMTVQTALARGKLKGVWKFTEFSISGPNAGSTINTPAQPGIFSFTKKHYSIMFLSSDKPRPEYRLQGATDAEKMMAWEPFSANSGTYEIKGTTLTTHPVIAKNPTVMKPGAFVTYVFSVKGKTLLLTPKDSNTVPGGNPPTFKLIRLE